MQATHPANAKSRDLVQAAGEEGLSSLVRLHAEQAQEHSRVLLVLLSR